MGSSLLQCKPGWRAGGPHFPKQGWKGVRLSPEPPQATGSPQGAGSPEKSLLKLQTVAWRGALKGRKVQEACIVGQCQREAGCEQHRVQRPGEELLVLG